MAEVQATATIKDVKVTKGGYIYYVRIRGEETRVFAGGDYTEGTKHLSNAELVDFRHRAGY